MAVVADRLLETSEGPAVAIENADGSSPFILVCEHASNRIPEALGDLGLSLRDRESHAAWDIGALAVSRLLSSELDAPLVHQRFSRLVYDCNRPPESPAAIPAISEIYRIPGNEGLSEIARQQRIDEIYLPFRDALATFVAERMTSSDTPPAIVTIHSFTPVYNGVPRDLDLGILHDSDSRLSDRLLEEAVKDAGYGTRRNAPYGPEDGVTHTLQLHAIAHGLHNTMLEIRNNLIADTAGQKLWARRISDLLREASAGWWDNENRSQQGGQLS